MYMTREQLEAYRSMKEEIEELKRKQGEMRYKDRIVRMEQECSIIEDYIDGISDSLTRRIFRMYYMEGISQKQIGRIVHLDKSNVSRRIDNFLKVATHATNATL